MKKIRIRPCWTRWNFWSTRLWRQSRSAKNLPTNMTKCSILFRLLTSVLKNLRTINFICLTSSRATVTRVVSSISLKLKIWTKSRGNNSRTVSKWRTTIRKPPEMLSKRKKRRPSDRKTNRLKTVKTVWGRSPVLEKRLTDDDENMSKTVLF